MSEVLKKEFNCRHCSKKSTLFSRSTPNAWNKYVSKRYSKLSCYNCSVKKLLYPIITGRFSAEEVCGNCGYSHLISLSPTEETDPNDVSTTCDRCKSIVHTYCIADITVENPICFKCTYDVGIGGMIAVYELDKYSETIVNHKFLDDFTKKPLFPTKEEVDGISDVFLENILLVHFSDDSIKEVFESYEDHHLKKVFHDISEYFQRRLTREIPSSDGSGNFVLINDGFEHTWYEKQPLTQRQLLEARKGGGAGGVLSFFPKNMRVQFSEDLCEKFDFLRSSWNTHLQYLATSIELLISLLYLKIDRQVETIRMRRNSNCDPKEERIIIDCFRLIVFLSSSHSYTSGRGGDKVNKTYGLGIFGNTQTHENAQYIAITCFAAPQSSSADGVDYETGVRNIRILVEALETTKMTFLKGALTARNKRIKKFPPSNFHIGENEDGDGDGDEDTLIITSEDKKLRKRERNEIVIRDRWTILKKRKLDD